MGNFKPASFKKKDEVQAPKSPSRNPKEEQLGIFRSMVIRMIAQGKCMQEIVDFMYNPTIGEGSPLDKIITSGIIKYTTVEDRKKVLIDLEEAKQI
jgi:hypothetical protein